jgi:hypothetical protein
MDGWRKIIKDERLLLRHIALVQNSMRAAKVVPLWSNFWTMRYRRDMEQYFDSRMWKKFCAWWNLMYDIGDIDRPVSKAKLGYAWGYLVCEVMFRKHGKRREFDPSKFGLAETTAADLRERVLKDYEALTLA